MVEARLWPGGITGFLVAFIFTLGAVGCGDEVRPEDGTDRPTTGPSSTAAGSAERSGSTLEDSGAPGGDTPTEPRTTTPTAEPQTYVVQAGDSLGAICAVHVESLPVDECVAATVQLNGLADPGQIAVGQELLLPVGGLATAGEGAGPDQASTAGDAEQEQPGSTATNDGGQGLALAVVTQVIDGDTIEIEGGVRVRYIGMDAPEASGECFAAEATARNAALVLNKTVELEKDVSETDQYGRLLRYVYVDGVMVNEMLVAEGYAEAVAYPPDTRYQGRLESAQTQAFAHGAGLWSACVAPTGVNPSPPTQDDGAACPLGCTSPPPGCVIKGNISQSTGEKIYHVPGGGSGGSYEDTKISPEFGERWFCTEQEAAANGWRKARN